MSSLILTELMTLLQETDALLACPEPDIDTWETYSRRRQEIFARLQDLFQRETQGTSPALRDSLRLVLEKDHLLLQQLEVHRSRCRQQLAEVSKAQQALKSYTPALSARLLDYDA